MRVELLYRGAHIADQLTHRAHVANARDVAEDHRLVGEQAGRQEWEGGVLVSGGRHRSVEGIAAFDHELFHKPSSATRGEGYMTSAPAASSTVRPPVPDRG